MSTIRVYSDDLYCNARTFRVTSLIWGFPENCEEYENEISDLVNRNRKILGKEFKEFHAVNLNNKNWKPMAPIYEEVLKTLNQKVNDGKLGMLLMIISRMKYENNASVLKNMVTRWLTDRTGPIGAQFDSLEENDLPALYHRVDQLFPLLFYRELIGQPGDNFELYPDSIGKILNYADKEFLLSGTLGIAMPFNFYDIIRILGDTLMKILPKANFDGWPKSEQSLVIFEPLASGANYLVQSCDILSNFLFNHLRFKSGLNQQNFQLKSELLSRYINLASIEDEIMHSFTNNGQDIICINRNLWGKITIS